MLVSVEWVWTVMSVLWQKVFLRLSILITSAIRKMECMVCLQFKVRPMPLLVSLTSFVLLLFLSVLAAKVVLKNWVDRYLSKYTDKYLNCKSSAVSHLQVSPEAYINPTINTSSSRSYSMTRMFANCLPLYFSYMNNYSLSWWSGRDTWCVLSSLLNLGSYFPCLPVFFFCSFFLCLGTKKVFCSH